MNRSLAAIPLVALLLSACGDGASPLAPEAPARNTTPTYEFTARANTTGPKGQFWIITGSPETCSVDFWHYDANNPGSAAQIVKKCGTATLNDWSAEPYNGGDVSISADYNGASSWLGYVSGDLTTEMLVTQLPAGTTVTLTPYVNPGCTVTRWNTSNGWIMGPGPLVMQVGGNTYVEAFFMCS
ncbi:MAG TPA: hypothetical protein VF584_04640 [Longimicrobium sp.]|jgi:hypothetical protein